MGHAVNYDVFKTTTNKSEIYSYVNQAAIYEGDYHHEVGTIEFKNVCFNSKEEAKEYIEGLGGFYMQVAVKFKQNDGKYSKTLTDKEKQLQKAKQDYYSLDHKIHYADCKSEYIGCKHCGSKLARKYIKSNHCPLCNKDIRPESTLARLSNMKAKITKLEEDYKKQKRVEDAKKANKAETYWLVKTEYHV